MEHPWPSSIFGVIFHRKAHFWISFVSSQQDATGIIVYVVLNFEITSFSNCNNFKGFLRSYRSLIKGSLEHTKNYDLQLQFFPKLWFEKDDPEIISKYVDAKTDAKVEEKELDSDFAENSSVNVNIKASHTFQTDFFKKVYSLTIVSFTNWSIFILILANSPSSRCGDPPLNKLLLPKT